MDTIALFLVRLGLAAVMGAVVPPAARWSFDRLVGASNASPSVPEPNFIRATFLGLARGLIVVLVRVTVTVAR